MALPHTQHALKKYQHHKTIPFSVFIISGYGGVIFSNVRVVSRKEPCASTGSVDTEEYGPTHHDMTVSFAQKTLISLISSSSPRVRNSYLASNSNVCVVPFLLMLTSFAQGIFGLPIRQPHKALFLKNVLAIFASAV